MCAHVARLGEAGWSMPKIARAAGCSEATVWRLVRARKCWNLVADAILGLEP